MIYNYVQAPDGVFFRYLSGYDIVYFNENVNCRPKDLTSEQALEFGVFPLQIVTPPYHDPLTQALVLADAVLVNGVWTQVYQVAALSPEQIEQNENQAKTANKKQASSLLTETDWVEIPSVSDSANIPHLINYAEFMSYRLALRSIAVNPPVSAVFPAKPNEVWSQ